MQINQFTLNPYFLVNLDWFPSVSEQAGPGPPCPVTWHFSPKQKQLLSEGLWWPKTASSPLFPLLEIAFLPAEEQPLYVTIKTTIAFKNYL